MKSSDLFLRSLEEEGVEYIFGVPGEENADIMISLLNSSIKFIMTRHEQGAAFMADLYGRLTGRPGVCLSTLGPGAANLVTGVANANFDHSPVVAITGQASTARLHKESHQNMDVISMFKPITKWTATIRQPANIPEVVHKAFKLAAYEKPGACHIELPEDIAKQEVDLAPIPAIGYKLRRPAPDYKAIGKAVDLIRNAKTPIILAGNGCIRKRASRQLRRFVSQTGIMAAMTFMAKGALDPRDSRSLMVAGLGSRDHVTEAFESADLIITIGYDLIEWPPNMWNKGMDKKIIHIDFEPAEVDNFYRCDVEIVSDLAAALWELNKQLGDSVKFDVPRFTHIRDHMVCELGFSELASGIHDDIDRNALDAVRSDRFPMTPQRILRDLRDVLDDQDILISDVGAHKIWVARNYLTGVPSTVIISNGFCSMGIALPGAIAAKLIMPDRKVVAVVGDGAFMMNVQELITAVQYKIPAVFLVWVDGRFGLIEWKQLNQFGKTSHVEFRNPDFVMLAESFGARGIRVSSVAEFKGAMAEALAETEKPTVVEVPVDHTENHKLSERLGRLLAR
jgi:acetolactate synthase-1/2/3 large subunit